MDVVTLGESMILFVPTRMGLLRYAHQFDRFVAGAESNTAIGLARLGHQVSWISKVGNDEFGKHLCAFLRGEKVNVDSVRFADDAPTGVFFKERRSTDTTRVYYYRSGSAASRLTPDDLDVDTIKNAHFLHLTGITPALSDSCASMFMEAIQIANQSNTQISFDPNLRLKLWSAEAARRFYLEVIPKVQIVLTSEDEAALITGIQEPTAAAQRLLEMGPEKVIVKCGAQGAVGAYAGETVHADALKVNAIETVGAGDAFNAGFLSGQLRGWDMAASLQLGNIMGALATTAPGDIEGLPDWEEVQSYLGGDAPVDR